MLQNTFIHIQGIGPKTEQRLWDSGLRDWDAILDDISIPISTGRKYLLEKGIEKSKQHLEDCNPGYFSKLLLSTNPTLGNNKIHAALSPTQAAEIWCKTSVIQNPSVTSSMKMSLISSPE